MASQKLQHKILATPFRSPLITKSITDNSNAAVKIESEDINLLPSLKARGKGKESMYSTPLRPDSKQHTRSRPPSLAQSPAVSKKLFASSKAASPFKSPFIIPTSTSSTPVRPQSSAPNIKVLERKLQLLKRATKIKQDEDEEKLTGLVKKWRTAGREVAWEVWQIVKEQGQEDGGGWGAETKSKKAVPISESWGWNDPAKKTSADSGMRDSWGWDDGSRSRDAAGGDEEDLSTWTPPSPRELEKELYRSLRKKPAVERKTMLPPTPRGAYYEHQTGSSRRNIRIEDTEDQEDADEEEGAEEEKKQDTLGTMLLRLGIARETLGWDEEEGDFVDT